jgi:hypothetical protein
VKKNLVNDVAMCDTTETNFRNSYSAVSFFEQRFLNKYMALEVLYLLPMPYGKKEAPNQCYLTKQYDKNYLTLSPNS